MIESVLDAAQLAAIIELTGIDPESSVEIWQKAKLNFLETSFIKRGVF